MWKAALSLIAASPLLAHTITGTVVGPDGVIAGARVDFRYSSNPGVIAHMAIADASGRFSGPAPDKQILFLAASAPGYGDFFDPNGQEITRDATVRIRMNRIVRVRGEIVAPDGRAIAGTVELFSLTRAGNSEAGRQTPVASAETASGFFDLEVPGDYYSIHVRGAAQKLASGRLNIDARSNRTGLRVTAAAREGHLMIAAAPRRELITISAPDQNFDATVTGAAGATEPLSSVAVTNIMTGQLQNTVSAADGSFSARIFAAPGSSLSIRHDPTGWYIPLSATNGFGPPATFLFVTPAPNEISAVTLIDPSLLEGGNTLTVETFGSLDAGQAVVSGAMLDRQWQPGETVTLSGRITLLSKNLGTDVSSIALNGNITLVPRFDAAGRQHAAENTFFSTVLTPTGLPLERKINDRFLAGLTFSNLRSAGAGRAEADWTLTTTISGIAPGRYQPAVRLNISGVPGGGRFLDAPTVIGGFFFSTNGFLPLVTVGEAAPPRLAWALALDDFDNGQRGTIANEDIGRYELANHVAMQTRTFVLAWKDERTGTPIRYRLEPFLPMLTTFDAQRSAVTFHDPAGVLRVKVHRPDGTVDDLGSAPFRQAQHRSIFTQGGFRLSLGTAAFPAVLALSTLDPKFEYAFAQSGLHRIEMTGTAVDAFGTSYEGGGTYDVYAGRSLDIDPTVIPGTPMEIGNSISAGVTLTPPVPAHVEVRVRQEPGSIQHVVSGRANRFGRFEAKDFTFSSPGEFRVDVTATHVDDEGVIWAGGATWGSIVETPNSPIVTHGRRGFDTAPDIGQQWFGFRDDGLQPGDHVMYPFHSGDVMWMEDTDRFSGIADTPVVSLQDTAGAFEARVRERWNRHRPVMSSSVPFDERMAAGEIPLFSSPEVPDQWGYAYLYAERPSIRVREMISEDFTPASYWRFRDNYHFQTGVGNHGDLTNDFKFQFGGAVWRDETDGFRYYGAYGSFFVLIPERDVIGGRIMPPFGQGGPLLTLKGKEIELFFHPTGVRPGTIALRGEKLSFAGYSAPTLPSHVEILVTSPSGITRTIRGQANKIGWFHDRAQDFFAFESGVWKAKVSITFTGRTSAGPVSEPFPRGDVLGSREGEFYFYVVDPHAPQLELAPMPKFVRPAEGAVSFTVLPPPGLTNVQLTRTTTMPGFILEEAATASMTYRYDAAALARSFPNLDLIDPDNRAGVDPITISFLLTGTDPSGVRRHFARQLVIAGEEVQMPDQNPGTPRRRGVRK